MVTLRKRLATHINKIEKLRGEVLSEKKMTELLQKLAIAQDYYVADGHEDKEDPYKIIQDAARHLRNALPDLEKIIEGKHALHSIILLAQDENRNFEHYIDAEQSLPEILTIDNLENAESALKRIVEMQEIMKWFLSLTETNAAKRKKAPESVMNKQSLFVEYLADTWHEYTGKNATVTTNPISNMREGPFVDFVCEIALIINPQTTLSGEKIFVALKWLREGLKQ
jgi:hypothetical protein